LLREGYHHLYPEQDKKHAARRERGIILLDINFSAGINSGNEGLFWLSEIKKAYPSIQVVLFTAYADIDLAVRGIKEGATDFVVKPWDNAKLLETLQAAYQIRSANHKGGVGNKQLVSKESGMFWGDSNAMRGDPSGRR